MDVEVGREYLAPDPDQDGMMIRVKVVGFGGPEDAVEAFEVEGRPIKRDVVWVMYLEGDRDGTTGKVLYEHFKKLD